MTIQHETITDPKIHEPKGATTAAINTVYKSNGAGSGVWQKVTDVMLDAATVKPFIAAGLADLSIALPREFWIEARIPDISTASTVLVSIPTSCVMVSAVLTLGGTITVANSTVNYKNAAGTTMGSATVPFAGSVEGTQVVTDLTLVGGSPHILTGPTWIKVQNVAGSTGVQQAYITFKATRST